MMSKLRLVALGSSFAAGPGITPIIDAAAQRSGRNFPHQLAEKLDADLTDLTVSGATLQHVLSEPQTTLRGITFQPQISQFPSGGADVVLILGGGNDMGYVSGMTFDSIQASTGPLKEMLQGLWEAPNGSVGIQQVTDRFVAVIDKIKELAPNAKIYLIDYLEVLGKATQAGQDVPLSKDQIESYLDRARKLTEAYQKAAETRPEATFIKPSGVSPGHEVGSDEPWMAGFTLQLLYDMIAGKANSTPYHPNLAGHTAIAEMLYSEIRDSRKS